MTTVPRNVGPLLQIQGLKTHFFTQDGTVRAIVHPVAAKPVREQHAQHPRDLVVARERNQTLASVARWQEAIVVA